LNKRYSLNIINEGIRNREIRDDLPPRLLRHSILGCIEPVCLISLVNAFARALQDLEVGKMEKQSR
jgi:hypothetical protein